MENIKLQVLLADDDIDDRDFFKEALEEISYPCALTTVNDDVELLDHLSSEYLKYPDIIFLDLNMPRKSGIECIEEIKSKEALSHIPIIIYSTSLDKTVVDNLYLLGAHHYIQKPSEFSGLKSVIKKSLSLIDGTDLNKRSRECFIIKP